MFMLFPANKLLDLVSVPKMKEIDAYVKEHAVKVCREKCIDEGLYGEALNICIKECVKSIRGEYYASRES